MLLEPGRSITYSLYANQSLVAGLSFVDSFAALDGWVVDCLRALNIDYVTSCPGSTFRGLQESIINYGMNSKPEFITCIHEEASVAMAHGHYEPPETRAIPLRPSWVFSDDEIAATGADYLALGHWDRPMRVGNGVVPAFYSGSPELARSVNLVRLTAGGDVVVTRETLIRQD